MQTLRVFEKGFGYLEACLSYYSENCAYFMLYLAALVFVAVKGTKQEKQIFIPGAILLLLTVYNPVTPVVLDKIFDVNSEYYRFFWIAPVIILVPYIAVRIIGLCQNRKQKAVTVILLITIGIFSGNFLYKNGYVPADNIYKMPKEMMQISEIIHKDAKETYPKAFLEYEYNMQMRQYDPKILLTIDREDYLYAVNNSYTDDMVHDDEHPQYRLLASIIRYQSVEQKAFLDALEATDTSYIAISDENRMVPFLKEAGLKIVGSTEHHVVFRYDVKNPDIFELVDYSVVY